MVSVIIVTAVVLIAWLVVSLPVALMVGRISREADHDKANRTPVSAFLAGTGQIGSITR
ncbi:hypothetical protein [Subtercola boreus]|uniref:hypothetical protein n=1 Tax=Subtercola boreus TaxID=120213 RepID=UPI00116F2A77|nr:hypothetical protein [Subtercola boreus]TQL53304.1 hypothetical protein FB464_0802 [Subtercola boreus]